MIRVALILLSLFVAAPVAAQDGALVAARPIRAGATVLPEDLGVSAAPVRGALTAPDEAVGREARLFLPAGRVIFPSDLAIPALIERNQLVRMTYRAGGLTIRAEGRALARAGLGERVRVMNTDSRQTIVATVVGSGAVEIK